MGEVSSYSNIMTKRISGEKRRKKSMYISISSIVGTYMLNQNIYTDNAIRVRLGKNENNYLFVYW